MAEGKTNAKQQPKAPEPVVAETPAEEQEVAFARDRILSMNEGPLITGCTFSEIAGALHGDASEAFTASEVRAKVADFRGRIAHPTEEA